MISNLTPPAWWITVIMLAAFVGIALIDVLPVAIRVLICLPLLILAIFYGYFQQIDAGNLLRTLMTRYALLLLGGALVIVAVWFHGEKRKILVSLVRLRVLEAEKITWDLEKNEWELRNENMVFRLGTLEREKADWQREKEQLLKDKP
jgi:hypothetical protein